jgi:DNA-binding response OmpR family regulator
MEQSVAVQRILLVEDDPALALGLCDALEFEGFEVLHTTSGKEAVELAASRDPKCIILDLMLPDLNGYQVCEKIRLRDRLVPILMLTARGQEVDKIRGLDVGADDYVTKPFSIGELVARLRALFRRAAHAAAPHPAEEPFVVGDASIDPATQVLTREGEDHPLSFYEVELLKLLFERKGQPVARDEILERIWGVNAQSTHRTIDNFIVKLRKKIEPSPEKPRHILTVYGVGYKLVP